MFVGMVDVDSAFWGMWIAKISMYRVMTIGLPTGLTWNYLVSHGWSCNVWLSIG